MRDHAPVFEGRLRWIAVSLLTAALLLAALPFDLGPSLLGRGQAGAASSMVGPLYWATHLGHGVLWGLLWLAADRVWRGRWRPLGWALASGVAALLFSPDGLYYLGSAVQFGGGLVLQGLQALWPTATGWAVTGGWLGWAAGSSGRRPLRLALHGAAAGAVGFAARTALLWAGAAVAGGPEGIAQPLGATLAGLAQTAATGLLLGLIVSPALKENKGRAAKG